MKIKLSVNVRYNRIEGSDKCHTFLIFEFTSNIMSTRDIGLEAYLPYTLSLMQFSSFDIFRITRRDGFYLLQKNNLEFPPKCRIIIPLILWNGMGGGVPHLITVHVNIEVTASAPPLDVRLVIPKPGLHIKC